MRSELENEYLAVLRKFTLIQRRINRYAKLQNSDKIETAKHDFLLTSELLHDLRKRVEEENGGWVPLC